MRASLFLESLSLAYNEVQLYLDWKFIFKEREVQIYLGLFHFKRQQEH